MQRLIYKYCLAILLCGLVSAVYAQKKNERDYLRSGNRLYRDSAYTKAEVDYRKAIEKNNRFPQSHYNLGNALMMQQKPKEAMEAYETASKLENNKKRLASIHHNMGVILQSQKQFAQAIECYKNALRNDPSRDGSRYNLVLCQHQLKNDPDQNDSGGDDNKDGKDQNKNKDEKNDKKDQKQEQNKQDQKDKQEQQQQQKQQDPNKMSKENAEQLLNAAMQDERNTQERLKKALNQPRRRQLEKQW